MNVNRSIHDLGGIRIVKAIDVTTDSDSGSDREESSSPIEIIQIELPHGTELPIEEGLTYDEDQLHGHTSKVSAQKCPYCPKKFNFSDELEEHMALCMTARPHGCEQCAKRFKTRTSLEQHMRTHSRVRPYPCNYCDKTFIQKSHVDQHERIHTGAKPFICDYCGRQFRQRSGQLTHEASHLK